MKLENLGLEIRLLSNLIYKRMNQVTMEAEKLTFHQCLILQHLMENEKKEIYQKDIENLFSIKRSTANQMLKTMEVRGYIVRITSKEDSRKNILNITPNGKKACENLTQNMYDFMKKLHGDIDTKELIQFQKTLKRLQKNIE